MPSLGGWEFVILIGILVLLFGAKRLPDMARSIGQSARVFKGEMKGMKNDDSSSGDAARTEPPAQTPPPPAALPHAQQAPVQQTPVQQAPVQQAPAQPVQPARQDAAAEPPRVSHPGSTTGQ